MKLLAVSTEYLSLPSIKIGKSTHTNLILQSIKSFAGRWLQLKYPFLFPSRHPKIIRQIQQQTANAKRQTHGSFSLPQTEKKIKQSPSIQNNNRKSLSEFNELCRTNEIFLFFLFSFMKIYLWEKFIVPLCVTGHFRVPSSSSASSLS